MYLNILFLSFLFSRGGAMTIMIAWPEKEQRIQKPGLVYLTRGETWDRADLRNELLRQLPGSKMPPYDASF